MGRGVRLTLLLICAAGASRLLADERRPLPAFTVASAAGASVTGAQLAGQGRPLLVLVTPACRACDRLIASLIEWQPTLPPGRIAIIISAPPDEARDYAQARGLTDAAGIAWYADPVGAVSSSLSVPRVPSIVAVDGGRVDWIVSGVLNAPSALEPIVRSWMNR